MPTMLDLAHEARALGAHVVLAYLPGDMLGHCDVDAGEIIVDLRLTEAHRKEVLAHELSHYRAGHPCSTSTYEYRADRKAAQMLVAVEDYRAAAAIYPGDPGAIADELGVTRRIVRLFEKQLPPLQRGA